MRTRLCLLVIVAATMLSPHSCATVANHSPIITSLEAEPKGVFPSGSCQIVCTASDPDGDELSYNWSASAGKIDGDGPTVIWNAPDSEGIYNIAVTVTDSKGGEVTDYVIVTVKVNSPPTITSLIADADWTTPSHGLQVKCDGEDPDGDELDYEWSTSGGHIDGTGPEVIWTAPEEVGMYDITVVVNDGHGGSATEMLSISVMPDQPPDIEALEITKDRYGHCYLKAYSGGYKVGQAQKYDIECIVSDMVPDTSVELFYEWSCNGGEISEISGDGSMITWTAPNTSGEVTVTVTVSDIAGNMASESIVLQVVSCSPCTFRSC
jgi:hypothetical protein